ncbi:hypothetical protein NPIL_588701 [Nephila pilipes]|uniref:Gag-like protein n=1 Tax=Nephila pilipes TaxID=299642 RepID=A0A8X6UU89_NEPPI|nr:hypothetical protein NPIL_588701 [Nephila pilipes]
MPELMGNYQTTGNTPVKGKSKARKSTEPQAAKTPRTEEPNCSNRFSSLTIEDNEEEIEMDAGETTPMPSPTKSQKSNPRPTTNAKIPRRQMAPPITIDNIRNGATLLKALQDLTKVKLIAKLTGTNLKILPQTTHAYHIIRRYIDEQNLQAHTYMLPEDKKIRVVIRGMPIDMPPEEIEQGLKEKNITVDEECALKSTDTPKCCLCGGNHPASYLACPRNPINHPPKPKATAPTENRWRRRAATSTPLQEAQKVPTTIINTEDFPPLPSKPETIKPHPKTTGNNIEDPFTILKSEKCQTLYKELQQFVRIANNVPTKAGRMAALFKFIEEDNN